MPVATGDIRSIPLDLTFDAAITSTALSEDERRLAQFLAARLWDQRGSLILSNLYYEGLQSVSSLGISTPPELKNLRTIMGWGQSGVDGVDERLTVQGFRFPDALAADDDLWGIWQANDMDAEHTLVHLDSMIYGSAHVVVGLDDDGEPVITTESPMDMTTYVDTRRRATTCAYQTYFDVDPASETYGRQRCALYTTESTIHLVNSARGWDVVDRDDHRFGRVPVVSFPNRQRTGVRVGVSEILPSWRNTIDRACRATSRLETTSEFYSAPKMILLGVAESAFQNADGSAKSAWETYIGRVLALETDETSGERPTVQRFEAENPDGLIKVIDHETRVMAGHTGLPPQYLGIFSDGNPASADAIRMSDFRLKMKSDRKTVALGNRWEDVMRIAIELRDGTLPDGADRIETDWAPTGIPTPAADTDAITKQITAGMVPPTSDVALAKVGYSAVERARIANDTREQEGHSALQGILAATRQPAQDAPLTQASAGLASPEQLAVGHDEPSRVPSG